VSDRAFHDVTPKGCLPFKNQNNHLLAIPALNEFSAREIQAFAEDIEKTDLERFKALNWGLRAWDNWYFNDVDHRFGDSWPGRIPAQLVAHTLFYFTKENDLVLDPMAGGGVVADTCLAFNRQCCSFDLLDRIKTRPERASRPLMKIRITPS